MEGDRVATEELLRRAIYRGEGPAQRREGEARQ